VASNCVDLAAALDQYQVVRIIAGIAKGRLLEPPRGTATRPTSDRVREAIFSAIEARLDLADAEVLDLFAGTGALGLEAISRGAVAAVFVDDDAECERLILRNGSAVGLAGAMRVLRMDVHAALGELKAQGRSFDLVLADPPYANPVNDLLDAIANTQLLAQRGLLVLEHGGKRELNPPRGLTLLHTRRYGDTAVTFFSTETAPPASLPI
jgi:16S rRNA (guanine(966)-N(2))-methyltransferase RsmD